ncbi:MAG: hypothetical protein WCO54_04700 [Bacteroidota bacterium]
MKRYILIILFIGSVFTSETLFAQGRCERKVDAKSQVVIPTRGKNQKIKVDKKGGERMYLKNANIKSRGQMPKCMVSLANEINQDVDVYIDGNYMGSIKSNVTGVIESLDGYSEVYCLSADKKISWTENGDCNCIYVFKLNTEVSK